MFRHLRSYHNFLQKESYSHELIESIREKGGDPSGVIMKRALSIFFVLVLKNKMKQLVNSGKILDATDFSRFKAALNNYRQEKLGSESITITDEDFVDIERVKAIISELNYNCENQQLIIKEYMKLIVGIAFDVWRSERRQIEKLHKNQDSVIYNLIWNCLIHLERKK